VRAGILFVALCGFAINGAAGGKGDLPSFVAKAADALKAAIPGSQTEVEGTMALVKKDTVPAPNTPGQSPRPSQSPGHAAEIPSANGVIFVIDAERYWTTQPFAGRGVSVQKPKAPKTPAFDHQHAKLLGGYYHTNGVQLYEKSNVVLLVDVLFGQRADTAMLQRAYAELTRVAASEL
jgi:hypothetical protein